MFFGHISRLFFIKLQAVFQVSAGFGFTDGWADEWTGGRTDKPKLAFSGTQGIILPYKVN